MPVTDPRAGRCQARELAAVRALAVPPQHDLVAGRDHVIDGDPHIGESRAIQADCALQHPGSTARPQLRRFGGDWLTASLRSAGRPNKVAVVEGLLEQPA